jgi:UDP-N-acetylmuramate dehydrogenase
MSILENHSLKRYNTFGVDVSARYFCRVKTREDFIYLVQHRFRQTGNILLLGEGSNILLCRDFDGLVVKNEINGIEMIKEDSDHVWVTSLSGTIWQDLVSYCVGRNYGGIENLSLIPGTVGAAPIQNIGAYGVELKDTFVSLEAIDLQTGDVLVFTKDACGFGYRQSVFKGAEKGKYFIYAVTLKLSKHPALNTLYGDIQKVLERKTGHATATIRDVSDAVIEIRKSKLPDPQLIGNAGSFFKNPEIEISGAERLKEKYPAMPFYPSHDRIKIPAAWLIEQCGWKGKRIGNTGNHERQALVIVNYGNATGEEILQHAKNVQRSVNERFGILLEPEVNFIC